MSTRHLPRVRVPAQARVGEFVEIKCLISHEMETGQRRDAQGVPIPRRIIHTFVARFNGREFFRADWHPSISANPYQSFFLKATESGELDFAWTDDDGSIYTAKSRIAVS